MAMMSLRRGKMKNSRIVIAWYAGLEAFLLGVRIVVPAPVVWRVLASNVRLRGITLRRPLVAVVAVLRHVIVGLRECNWIVSYTSREWGGAIDGSL